MLRQVAPDSVRELAAEVVFRVLAEGGFIARELDQKLLLHPDLAPRDRALLTELSYGVIRCLAALDERLLRHAPRGIKDGQLRAHLLVAAYQLCVLSRVPAFAAVDAAVTAARKLAGPKVAGFANAVLRKVANDGKLTRDEALRNSAPAWLFSAIESAVGPAQAAALFGIGVNPGPAETCARFLPGYPLPPWAEEGEPGRLLNSVRRFRRAGDLRRHLEWEQGQFVVQEEGAAVCGLLLGARQGERVLDACAGRGQKTSLLAEQVASEGSVWATDNQALKLSQLADEFSRLRLPAPEVHIADWSKPQPEIPHDFDRVLVDAPCTGTGTLRHRPEIALRLTENDAARLAGKAELMLKNAATHVKPGGTLLFVVCSVLPRECEDVVHVLAGQGFMPAPLEGELATKLVGAEATSLRLLPGVHGTDGFFVAHFRRV